MAKPGGARKANCPPGCMDAQIASSLIAAAADLSLFVDSAGIIQEVVVGEANTKKRPGWQSLVGRRWVETAAIDSHNKVDELLKEARTGARPRARHINLQADGMGEVPFRFSAVLDDHNERVIAVGRDLSSLAELQQQIISAQQAMEREIGRQRQAETRYRLLFQVTSEGALVVDAGTLRVLEANQVAEGLVDEGGAALQRRTLEDLFDTKSWSAVQALLVAAQSGGRPADVTARLLSRKREVTVSVSTFRQSGATMLLVRLRPTAAARQSVATRESRLLATLDAFPDGFVVTDLERRILAANTAFCDLVQMANENQVVGQELDRWLGRPGVDLSIVDANLREHGAVRNFSTIVRDELGASQEAIVSAVAAQDANVPCFGFSIRAASPRLTAVGGAGPLPRSVDQLRELVGRVALKEIVRESADLIERLCIEAALQVSGDNRALAAQLLGLSRQGLYSKLRRHGLGDLGDMDPSEMD